MHSDFFSKGISSCVFPAKEDVIQFSPLRAAENFGTVTRISGPEAQLRSHSTLTFPQATPEVFATSFRFSRHKLQSVDWITSSFAGTTSTLPWEKRQ